MDINTILWIVGIIVSASLAYWGIWHNKKSKSIPEVTLVESQTIYLLNTIHEKFQTLVIKYNGAPITNNLVYYESILVNNGQVDIDSNRFHGPIEFSLPNGYRIIESNITNQSNKNIQSKIWQGNNVLYVEWQLLKSQEHFKIECIIDSPINETNNQISNIVKITNRVTDLKDIDITTLRTDYWEHILQNKFISLYKEEIRTIGLSITIPFFPFIILIPYCIWKGFKIESLISYLDFEDITSFGSLCIFSLTLISIWLVITQTLQLIKLIKKDNRIRTLAKAILSET